jgi:OFA family oxalate/formate antiporter-like MFS transporter
MVLSPWREFSCNWLLGAVYAWSVFRVPLVKQFGWSISEVTLTFTISIFVLGIAAFVGGLWLNRQGPRIVAVTGGALYGLGVFLASFSAHRLWWLYLSYGLIGGIGVGFAYIVPVAVLVKWFPDRRGLITGVAVGGFGAGALIVAPLATHLIHSVGVLSTFAYLGVGYLIVTVAGGLFMHNPPDGWKPQGWAPTRFWNLRNARARLHAERGANDLAMVRPVAPAVSQYLRGHFDHLAGVADLSGVDGRDRGRGGGHGWPGEHRQRSRAASFWAWVSDLITRRATFVIMFVAFKPSSSGFCRVSPAPR